MKRKSSVRTSPNLNPRRIVRRYLDLPKYLDLLRSQALYLCRADGFDDRFEGALTPGIRKALDDAHQAKQITYDADYFYRRSRGGSYVSCWSLGAHDNMALWQLYGGVSASLAVTSTVDRLIDMALRWQEEVFIYRVRYIDHFKNPDMIIGSYTDLLEFKHQAYEYEQEVRIIVPRQNDEWERNQPSIRLPAGDLSAVIRSVVVAPEAQAWFFDLVEDVTRKYGLSSPVRRSKMAYLP
jgi:hypothetical protein